MSAIVKELRILINYADGQELTSSEAKSWSVEVEFKVGRHTGLAGDGFAFWYSTEKEQEGMP